jgi:nucleoside-diphosphate-sugar epimerase
VKTDPASEEELEDALSRPPDWLVKRQRGLEGDILVLGAGGKMGPTMARMARRAADLAGLSRRVIAVSRFSDAAARTRLEAYGVETIACDLLEEEALASLPDAPNVIYLAGMKFGTSGNEALTWAMNTWLPGLVCRRWRHSRVVALSTGNVYGLVSADSGGSLETDTPEPVGEYAMSCLGRERMFQHFSERLGIPTALVRLNYAAEPRYGVLADIARKVWGKHPVDVTMGRFNTIWQGDANAMILGLLGEARVPAEIYNLTGANSLSTREIAEVFGREFGKPVTFTGRESTTALLSDSRKIHEIFGEPQVGVRQMLERICDWIANGGGDHGKPTHFEVRDGKF